MPETVTPHQALSQPPTSQLSGRSGQFPDPIEALVPFGSLALLVGAPKVGKTALYASWFPRIWAEKPICGFATHRPSALGVLTTDHKWALNQGLWFDRVGFSEFKHFSLRDHTNTKWRWLRDSAQTRLDLLRWGLDKLALPPGGLVALDIATVFISNKLNDYNEVAAGCGEVCQVLDERQLTAIGLGHMSKQKSDPKDRYVRAHERVSGSGAQVGFSDSVLYLLGPDDTGKQYHTFGWVATSVKAGTFDFIQDPETGLFKPYYVLGGTVVALDDKLHQVIDAFPPHPEELSYAQVIAMIESACGVAETQAKERLTDLLLDGRIVKSRHGKYSRNKPS